MAVSVRRPRAIVFDILGTASKSGFLERILFPFLKTNLDTFIGTHWTKKDFIKLYDRIRDQSIEFNKQEPLTPIVVPHDNPQARSSLMNFINFVTDNGVNSPTVTQLRFKVWFEGYQQSKIKTPIYGDVPSQMRKWFAEGIKFHVYSNTWIEAQKALLRNTNHGDLTNLISGHYDNESFGPLTESETWRKFCVEIKESPNDVLFLTKSPAEAHAASDAGVVVILVLTHRHNVKAVTHEDRQRFPFVRTFYDLMWLEGSMMPNSETPTDRGSDVQGQVPTAISVQSGTAASQPHTSGSSANAVPRSTNTSSGATSGASSGATSKGSSAPSRPSGSSANRTSTATVTGTSGTRPASSHSRTQTKKPSKS